MLRWLSAPLLSVTLLAPAVAWPCSLIDRPARLEVLAGPPSPMLTDAGGDAAAPGKPALSNLDVTLIDSPCDGRGAACPQLDVLRVNVAASDDQTPVERLRYVAYFGATTEEAAARAEPEVVFFADRDAPTRISAWLGLAGARSGRHFQRAQLCFALAAVDEAANVGPRSDVTCVDTTDHAAATSTIVQGAPCVLGCGGCGSTGSIAPLALLALAAWRRRRR